LDTDEALFDERSQPTAHGTFVHLIASAEIGVRCPAEALHGAKREYVTIQKFGRGREIFATQDLDGDDGVELGFGLDDGRCVG
jgi:hypothetical protein